MMVMQGDRFSMNQQIQNFQTTLNQYRSMTNPIAMDQFLAKSIAVVVTGNNDYLNNYLMPALYRSSFNYSAQQFGNLLVNNFGQQILVNWIEHLLYLLVFGMLKNWLVLDEELIWKMLQALHNLGLRKFFLAGIGPLGCIPNIRASGFAPVGRCVDLVNQIVGFFNEGLRSMVEQLNRDHPDSIFTYANTYHVLGDVLNNPARYRK